jgi:hypothetical protein
VQQVIKIGFATQTHPGYPGYAVLATKVRDKCISTIGIAFYKSNHRYYHHQANYIAHPDKSFEATPFLNGKNTL